MKDGRKERRRTGKEEKEDRLMEGRINCIVTEKKGNKKERKEN